MLTIQPLRWGKPYNSLDTFDVIHFDTGESIAKIGQVTGGMVQLDMRKAEQARKALRKFSCDDLIQKCQNAAQLFVHEPLPVGDGIQRVGDFILQQSASPGLP